MELIGAYLKKSREEKKIKISSVCKILMISRETINDIENDDFPNYIDKVYLVGHLRSYANFLNLDADLVVKNFKAQTLIVDIKNINQIPKPLVKNNLFNLTGTVSFFSIIIITFVFYFFFINSNGLESKFSIIPDIPENLQYVIEENEVNLALNKINKTSISEDNIQPVNKYLEKDLLSEQSSKSQIDVIASSSPINESNNTSDKITLKFLDETWIQLRDNQDQIVVSKLMKKDDEYIYLIKDNYTLTTGNAGNIIVLINQEIRGKIGKKGEVIDSLIIHSEFSN